MCRCPGECLRSTQAQSLPLTIIWGDRGCQAPATLSSGSGLPDAHTKSDLRRASTNRQEEARLPEITPSFRIRRWNLQKQPAPQGSRRRGRAAMAGVMSRTAGQALSTAFLGGPLHSRQGSSSRVLTQSRALPQITRRVAIVLSTTVGSALLGSSPAEVCPSRVWLAQTAPWLGTPPPGRCRLPSGSQ